MPRGIKNIVVGISGGIAVYKVCTLIRLLKKSGFNVDVIMTKHATEFVSPLTFEVLSDNPVTVDMFHRETPWEVEHISLAQKADLFVVCPATANIIGKYANGIADDMLSTTLLAATCPVLICPAMNVNMYNNLAVSANIQLLESRGVYFADSPSGELACGDVGKGRLAEPQTIYERICEILNVSQDLKGKNILVTCGATLEKLDDVRFISNFSSGKMGCAIAERALLRGANVTMVVGKHSAVLPNGIKTVDVVTTEDMYNAVMDNVDGNDVIIMAAAPCDYRPKTFSEIKIKSDTLKLDFVKNPDIAANVGKIKSDKKLVIFSAETDNETVNAQKKLHSKNADFVVINNIKKNDVFGSDSNVVTIIDRSGTAVDYAKMDKKQVADIILDKVLEIL
ncbi:MAG: bifunctional phosphopantothenoylcysteine decarboxylase/phosphopantothenate--cysteine ligase CoaBC [Corallococcus sp.]|nr:bifunctional phosphopantothenoylcysteine decarboxylase/phosphopantothenate--cysteine ligase CoaBC [Corallococcus sp.]